MALSIKFRFMRMVKKFAPMTITALKRRTTGQFNPAVNKNSMTYKEVGIFIHKLHKQKLIKPVYDEEEGRYVVVLSDAGEKWLVKEEMKG